jgi:hypothetical protein
MQAFDTMRWATATAAAAAAAAAAAGGRHRSLSHHPKLRQHCQVANFQENTPKGPKRSVFSSFNQT